MMARCVAGALAALLLAGCRSAPPPAPEPVRDVVERGPLRLVVEASPPTLLLGDPLQVTLELTLPEGYLAQLPDVSAFGELAAAESDRAEARPIGGGMRRWRQTFVVQTYTSGTLELPPMIVKYATAAADGTPPAFDAELASNVLKVDVRSALTTQDSVADPRDITGTLVPPWRPTPRQLALWTAGAIAVAIGVVLLVHYIRRRVLRPTPPEPPEVWALRMLRGLSGTEWIQPDRAREGCYRLSEIVRAYIERKFGLAAPERTTDEFLALLARDHAALPYDPTRLQRFLEACDAVKYAAQPLDRDSGEDLLETARAFVSATAAAADAGATQTPTGAPRRAADAGAPANAGATP
ncbi:MAG: hypothetical protein AB7Q17_01045 [Phycisphaerae bacterium]